MRETHRSKPRSTYDRGVLCSASYHLTTGEVHVEQLFNGRVRIVTTGEVVVDAEKAVAMLTVLLSAARNARDQLDVLARHRPAVEVAS